MSEQADGSIRLPEGAREVRVGGELPPGVTARLQIEARGEGGEWSRAGEVNLSGPPAAHGWAGWRARLALLGGRADQILLWVSLALYLAVRLAALPQYPIYFFSDEALQTVTAADLVHNGMRGTGNVFLPTYFPNGGQYNLSVSVYAQVLPYLMFGKSIWVTRGTSVVLSLLAAGCVALALLRAFGMRRAWLGVLALSAAPAWFLHSRTAFETALAVDFFAAFLCAYLAYRGGRPRWLYAAVAFGALCFYAYSPAQLVILAAAALLFISDLPFHLRHWRYVLPGLGLVLMLCVPYLRHRDLHPQSLYTHLQILDSYWVQPLSTGEKIREAAGIYLQGLDPVYWFLPNKIDLDRHRMGSLGHLLRWTFPFFLVGLGAALWRVRRPEQRAVLLALLASPVGATPVGLGVTRVLFYVVPAVLLTAQGFDLVIELIGRRKPVLRPLAAGAALLALGFSSPWLLRTALVDGPFWSRDYGMGGMQYGAGQVFSAIHQVLRESAKRPVVLSPTWANGTDVLVRYFFDDPIPVQVQSLKYLTDEYRVFAPETLFVFPPEDYLQISPRLFTTVEVERILPYPDGSPGFYFLRLGYAPDAREQLEALRAEQARPVEDTVDLLGMTVRVLHTRLDIGEIAHAFDGNDGTLVRTESANPMVVDLKFPRSVETGGVRLRVGGTPTRIRVQALEEGSSDPRVWVVDLPEVPDPRDALVSFDARLQVTDLRFEVYNANDPAEAHVHLWEIELK